MIQPITYFTASCDVCKESFKQSFPTEQQQVDALVANKWMVGRTNICICPKCAASEAVFLSRLPAEPELTMLQSVIGKTIKEIHLNPFDDGAAAIAHCKISYPPKKGDTDFYNQQENKEIPWDGKYRTRHRR